MKEKGLNDVRVEKWLGHEIRFVEIKSGKWGGVASDVCKALDLKRVSRALAGLRPDGAHTMSIIDRLGRQQSVKVIDERNIYLLIFKSRKKEAIQFQDWVFGILELLRQAAGLEGFQIFRTLDKEHQREEMSKLSKALRKPGKIDFIKANTIANKAISTRYGHSKMVKKGQMTPEMLVDREPILEDTVDLMGLVDKFELPVKVSEAIYQRYAPSTEIGINKYV